jgi:hypothetical protein
MVVGSAIRRQQSPCGPKLLPCQHGLRAPRCDTEFNAALFALLLSEKKRKPLAIRKRLSRKSTPGRQDATPTL